MWEYRAENDSKGATRKSFKRKAATLVSFTGRAALEIPAEKPQPEKLEQK